MRTTNSGWTYFAALLGSLILALALGQRAVKIPIKAPDDGTLPLGAVVDDGVPF